MLKPFRSNLVAHLIFFRRNRLVALIALVVCFIWGTMLLPSLLFMSANDKFDMVKMLINQSQGFVTFFAAALAVMTLTYNFNRRCFKMVITKPCPPEIWLLAHFGAVLLVALALHLIILSATIVLFLSWHIPMQWGVFYIVCESFLHTVAIVSILTFLVSVAHPFLAVLLMLVASEGTFYGLLTLLGAAVQHATKPWAELGYRLADAVAYALYLIIPGYSMFEKTATPIHYSLRMGWTDLGWLGLTTLYTILVGALSFTLAALALRRRSTV